MNIAIILAGGTGERMGTMTVPKQFADIYGKPVIIHTLETFDIHPKIDEIIVVCKTEFIDDLKILIRKFNIDKVKHIVAAGETRQESSLNGLNAVKDTAKDNTIVVIHDAVRPLLSGRIISENIKGAQKYGAVDTVFPAEDTVVKSVDGIFLDDIPERSELYIGQTPQSFIFNVLYEAHTSPQNKNLANSTDDCILVLNNGGKVGLVQGEKLNFKITTQEDLTLLKAVVKLGRLERI